MNMNVIHCETFLFRTIPATVLMAAAAAAQVAGSVVSEAIAAGQLRFQRSRGAAGTVTVAHPAGLASAGAKLTTTASGLMVSIGVRLVPLAECTNSLLACTHELYHP